MLSIGMKKYAICLAVLALSASCTASLREKITQIILRKEQTNVKFGILVVEPRSRARVFGYSESLALIPASNMKLVTSFTALKYLGRQFEYVTTAAISDKNLVIIGSGDPLLELADENSTDSNGVGDFLSDIVKALKERNITEIEDVLVDSSVFEDVRVHPDWPKEQLNRPYACEISGLNYNANCVKILASIKNGQVVLRTEPDTAYLTLTNNVQPTNKGESALAAYRTEKENVIEISGKYRKAASFDVAIERPAKFFGTLLAENLNKAGIKMSGQVAEANVNPEKLQTLVEHRTGIVKVLQQCNKDSFHLAAECLFKTLGARQTGGKWREPSHSGGGSWQAGQKAITNYLVSLGADAGSFNIDDGSGLSTQNKLSAGIIIRVLSDAYSSDLWPVFKETLSAGGIDGTLRKQFYQDRYRGKVFAKTGYINGVRALSGICTANSGKEYIFSILTNDANYKTKEAIFDIVKAIIDEG
ncbi:MAG: D-alanyl-D-alanine carboxypeptidase/D-alanyl-D-alanine-endopeptidase [Phycisphaerae bacterium]|nr:D-alanyl-D-alanine carboxypeptidase/D-alanyl-D-alanine-endopeptidase [Phycisphaerae bacterium]